MWSASSIRYSLLLPPPVSSTQSFRDTLLRRRSIVIASLVFVLVVLVVAALTFDFHSVFVSRRTSEIPSPTTSAVGYPLDDVPLSHDQNYAPPASFPEEQLSTEEITRMVSKTRGFYTRDYSLGLGWNNVRYIIEASALQAKLLNRTLILPSFVYARSCEYDLAVCADQAPMMNRGDAIGWDIWRDLPIEQQMGWQIPISIMINITQLRRFQPVVTTAEYLRYARLSPKIETTSGEWNRDAFHLSLNPTALGNDGTLGKPSLFVIENSWYDPNGVTRVDAIPDAMKDRGGWVAGNATIVQSGRWESRENGAAQSLLKSLLLDKTVVDWDEAQQAIRALTDQMPESVGGSSQDLDNDEFIEDILNQNGWEVLYTFEGAAGMDFVKHVVMPTRQVAQRTSIRAFTEDYLHVDADVIVLAGETHLYRKPGQMRFTTRSSLEMFQRLVVHHVVPLDKVYELARKFDFRMSAINGGRQWMAAHIRRGDFVAAGWAWGDSHEGHLERVKQHLDDGQSLLESEHRRVPYSVPDIAPDASMPERGPPIEGDKFFIATDERDPEKLDYFSNNGAIMFRDLVTFEDRHEFGWGILFSDIIGLVEQVTLSRASYFYGSAMSSFTGGVFNMRAVLGAEETTALAD